MEILEETDIVSCSQHPECSVICSDDCDCKDANDDSYSPDTGNYMSYTKEMLDWSFKVKILDWVTEFEKEQLEKGK